MHKRNLSTYIFRGCNVFDDNRLKGNTSICDLNGYITWGCLDLHHPLRQTNYTYDHRFLCVKLVYSSNITFENFRNL